MGELTFPFKFKCQEAEHDILYTCHAPIARSCQVSWNSPTLGFTARGYELENIKNYISNGDWAIISETLTTYTQSELDYIAELESRIDQLEDLCSDYAKIVSEKDDKIESLRDLVEYLSGCPTGI